MIILLLLIRNVVLVAEELHDVINDAVLLRSVLKNVPELRRVIHHARVFRDIEYRRSELIDSLVYHGVMATTIGIIVDLGHHDDLGVTKQVSYDGLRLLMPLWMVMMVSACGRRTLDHGVRQEFLGPGVRGVVHVLDEHTLDAFLRRLAPVREELKVVS